MQVYYPVHPNHTNQVVAQPTKPKVAISVHDGFLLGYSNFVDGQQAANYLNSIQCKYNYWQDQLSGNWFKSQFKGQPSTILTTFGICQEARELNARIVAENHHRQAQLAANYINRLYGRTLVVPCHKTDDLYWLKKDYNSNQIEDCSSLQIIYHAISLGWQPQ